MNEKRFDGKGEVYSKFRPSYPSEFIDYLFNYVGLSADSVVADIGSGTGKLTKQLLERGCRVYGVEPNPDMRKIAEEKLDGFGGFVSVDAVAEKTTLPDSSVDFITVAQAFHWFNRESFKQECRRILKPGGKVILAWNSRDEKSEAVRENAEVNRKHCPGFVYFTVGMNFDTCDFHDFFSGEYETRTFEFVLDFDENSFIGRNMSSSYAPKENTDAYISDLTDLFNKYKSGDILSIRHFTHSYIGEV